MGELLSSLPGLQKMTERQVPVLALAERLGLGAN